VFSANVSFVAGNITIPATGNIDAGTNYIGNVIDPVQPQDAATKYYVDQLTGNTHLGNLAISNTTISAAVEGTIRYNTDTPAVEVYNGNTWVAVGVTDYSITSQTISTADGSTTTFTLDQSTDAERILVAINGLGQNPGINYTVVGDQITFFEAPQISDIIEIRYISPIPSSGGVNSGVQYHLPYYATTGAVLSDSGSNLTWNGSNSLAVGGTITATGNISGNYILGNGSQLTGISASYGNSNVQAWLSTNSVSNIFFSTSGSYVGPPTTGNSSSGSKLVLYPQAGVGNADYALGIDDYTLWQSVPSNAPFLGDPYYFSWWGGNTLAATLTGAGVFSAVGDILTAGNISVTGNVYGNNFIITVTETVTGNVTAGNILTSGLVSASGNVTGNYILGNISFANGIPSTYSNSNVQAYGETGWAGNIIPSANVTYTLGNSTNWWANAWFGANTIYIGGAPLSQANGNLSFNGNSVVTANATGTSTTAGNVSIIGNITASYVLGNGSQLTGLPASYSNSNVTTLLAAYGSNTISTTGNINAGNVITSGALQGGTGTQGIALRPWTGGGSYAALYSTAITPADGNYSILVNGTNTWLNAGASGSLFFRINNNVSPTAFTINASQATVGSIGTANANAYATQTLVVAGGGLGVVGNSYFSNTVGVGGNISVTGNISAGNITVTTGLIVNGTPLVANNAANLNSIVSITTTGNVGIGGNLTVTGGVVKSSRLISSATSLTVADASGFIEFSSGPYTVTLPNPTQAANNGIGYRFWQNTSQDITLSTPAGNFYGPSGSSASTKVLAQATTQYWDVWSDGYNWAVFGIKTV